MTHQEIQLKIKDLLQSNKGENTFIAMCLMMSQLNLNEEEALAQLKPILTQEGNNKKSYQLNIAHIRLEYHYEEGYVPYMGAGVTVSRMLGLFEGNNLEYLADYATFLELEEQVANQDIETIIYKDYLQLIPTIAELLWSSD